MVSFALFLLPRPFPLGLLYLVSVLVVCFCFYWLILLVAVVFFLLPFAAPVSDVTGVVLSLFLCCSGVAL